MVETCVAFARFTAFGLWEAAGVPEKNHACKLHTEKFDNKWGICYLFTKVSQ